MQQPISQYPNFQLQLRNISEMQSKIEQTKKYINQLAKIEQNQTKQIQSLQKVQIATTRNKINLLESHTFNHKKHEQDSHERLMKQTKARQMKEKGQKQLKKIKEQMKNNKQNQRLLIRNNSIQYDLAIKRNKQLDLSKKEKIIKQIKQQREKYKESVAHSRLLIKKQKQMQIIHNDLAKIEKQPLIAKELTDLTHKKQELQQRLKNQREIKEQIKTGIESIKKMKDEQLLQALKLPSFLDKSNCHNPNQLPQIYSTLQTTKRAQSKLKFRTKANLKTEI